MSITVDALRGLSGNHGIVYNAETQTIAKSSVGHSVASLFGIKSAQAVNRQTFEEIKKAVLFDDRYFGVREKASQLLSQIDATKAIKASTIKSIALLK